jgi:hypothetical protein
MHMRAFPESSVYELNHQHIGQSVFRLTYGARLKERAGCPAPGLHNLQVGLQSLCIIDAVGIVEVKQLQHVQPAEAR